MLYPEDFKPYRTLKQCDEILTAPGATFEVQHTLVRGVMTKVFKNAPKNVRDFILAFVQIHSHKDFIVFENERWTYAQAFSDISRAASVFRDVYGIRKGDRVGIVMRNFPEFVIIFVACHLLGAVPVMVNAWVSAKTIAYCLTHTQCKLIILDPERADLLESSLESIRIEAGTTGTLVVRAHEGKGSWKNVRSWDAVMKKHTGKEEEKSWMKESACEPDDNAFIFFTSGTTGLPKGVLGSQRALISTTFNLASMALRRFLRESKSAVFSPPPRQPSSLISIPLFHVTGACVSLIPAFLTGGKLVLMRKWDTETAIELILKEKVTVAGGVPSVALDLLESKRFRNSDLGLESIGYGGASAPPQIPAKLSKLRYPVSNGQGYGLTETTAALVAVFGWDSLTRPTSTGLPSVVSDILIVDPKTKKSLPPGSVGEIWLKGPSVMTGYWRNPEATKKVLTQDGWFNSEDLGYLDNEGFLYVSGRVKDIIIRGGENIDALSVENALYDDERVGQAVVVGVPDARLGELPAAAVHLKPGKTATEQELIALTREKCAAFAVPVMIMFVDKPLEANAAGKIPKSGPRSSVRDEWLRRKAMSRQSSITSKVVERVKGIAKL